VLELVGVSKAYGDRQVLRDVSLRVQRSEKLAIIGPNGLGKSTLLKGIMGVLPLDGGAVRWGHETHAGYFAQDHHELLRNETATPLEYLWEACPEEAQSYVRGQLGRVLFSGEDVSKPIGALSGGESARLIFGRIIVEQPNVLVLDEPTNHLDLDAIAALVEGLRAFEGTVLFVSHDRWFVSQLATRILELTESGPRDFPGTYHEYLERCGDDHLDADAVIKRASESEAKEANQAAGSKSSRQSWEEQKRRRNRLAALPARRDKVLAAIEQAEARRASITALYGEAGFFQRTPKSEVDQLERESEALRIDIERWMAEWEAIEAELAALDP
jgi:ABC-type multidrug transport system ATPase subunit